MSPSRTSRRLLVMVVHANYPIGEPRVQREALAAVDAGWDVRVISLRREGEASIEEVEGVVVERLPVRHERGAGLGPMFIEYLVFATLAMAALIRLRLRRRARVDVVHIHAPPDFLAAAALPLKALGTRIVLDVHDLSPHIFGARFAGQLGGGTIEWLLLWVERGACALADAVVTVHEPYRRELETHGIPPRKLAVVMNAADERLLERVRNRPRPCRQDGFELAYHGTITAWYGVDLIVRAVALLRDKLPGVRAVVLGEGDALVTARALAQELGVDDRIEFSGRYLPIEDALARVAGADCGVIPNRPSQLNRFALSSKLLEYVALGLPVAVSGLETLAAHFDDDEVMFFEPGNAEALSCAVLAIAERPAEARARARRASERAAAYAWRVNSQRYVELLGRLGAS